MTLLHCVKYNTHFAIECCFSVVSPPAIDLKWALRIPTLRGTEEVDELNHARVTFLARNMELDSPLLRPSTSRAGPVEPPTLRHWLHDCVYYYTIPPTSHPVNLLSQ